MEPQANNKHTRKPTTAISLSIIMPGLGQIYCGALVLGLIITAIGILLLPILGLSLAQKNISLIILTGFLTNFYYLAVIFDAYRRAKRSDTNYQPKEYNKWYVYPLLILINMGGVLPITLLVKAHMVEAFKIPVAAGYPTLLPGDRILANKLIYNNQEPTPGDIIVFTAPNNRHSKYIKRIIACEGDTIEMRNNDVYVNGNKLERSEIPNQDLSSISINIEGKPLTGKGYYETINNKTYKIFISKPPHDQTLHDFTKITVPPNHCFVLGDNRNLTEDSRSFGMIPLATIIGKAEYLYCFSKDWSRFGKLQ